MVVINFDLTFNSIIQLTSLEMLALLLALPPQVDHLLAQLLDHLLVQL